jgi:hypothetical protein
MRVLVIDFILQMKKILTSFFFCLALALTIQVDAKTLSISDLVNLFISLGIISPEKADIARATVNTPSYTNINISGSWSCTSGAIKRTIVFKQDADNFSYTGKASDGYLITGSLDKNNLVDSWTKGSYSSSGSGTISPDGLSYKATWKDKNGNTGKDVCEKNINQATTKIATTSPVSVSLKTGDGYTLTTRYVVGGTDINGLTYNFISSTSSVVIKKLDFIVADGVVSITAGNIKVPVIFGKATVSGLNISVPVNSIGINVPVTLTFSNVGSSGVSSNSTTTIKLNTFSYSIDNGPLVVANGPKDIEPSFYIVSSKPTISFVQPPTTYFNSGNAEIGRVVVATDLKGPIQINSIPISSVVSGIGTFDDYIVKVDSKVIPSTVSNGVINLTDGYDIASGSLVTFCVFSKIDLKIRSSLITKLGPASLFKWTDVNGGMSFDAVLIPNYPTNSASVTNGD